MRHSARFGSFVEVLESRQFLTVTPMLAGTVSPLLIGVAPVSAPLNQGVTLHEKAGVPFTASVGTFVTLAPATNLRAAISWGDGTSSQGTLKPIGPVGVDRVRFEVDGTHTYQKPGNFTIKVVVAQPGPTPSSPIRIITSFKSLAIVTGMNVSLDGTITGKYSLAPTAAFLGAGYVFNGTGTAGDLGAVSAHGVVFIPPGINPSPTAVGSRAMGTLTLTQTGPSASPVLNSVTLSVSGPFQATSDGFPSTLKFTIISGTGAFAGATGAGSIAVTLGTDMTFSFTLTSLVPAV